MGKKKLTKYQWLVTLFLMLVYSLTVQIVARPLLIKQVLHNGSAIPTSSTTLLFLAEPYCYICQFADTFISGDYISNNRYGARHKS